MASDVQRWFDSEARQTEAIARAERDALAAEVSALRAALERIAEMATDGQGHNLTRAAAMGLEGRGYTITAAKEYVREHHRHNRPPVGGLFATAVELDGEVVGVAVAGRPSARAFDDGHTIEVTRCCTDGTRNACSKLYGSITRAAKALGWRRAYTYTLDNDDETGASLKASGWVIDAHLAARKGWDTPARERDNAHTPDGGRIRWRMDLRPLPDTPEVSP